MKRESEGSKSAHADRGRSWIIEAMRTLPLFSPAVMHLVRPTPKSVAVSAEPNALLTAAACQPSAAELIVGTLVARSAFIAPPPGQPTEPSTKVGMQIHKRQEIPIIRWPRKIANLSGIKTDPPLQELQNSADARQC